MPPWKRVIGHVDMDSFYVSVEVRDDPSLAGQRVVVGGDPRRRGVVSSASYEARKFGVRSAMPTSTAVRMCPGLIVIPGRMRKYQEVSRELRQVFDAFSPVVEPLSLDEAFLDLSGTGRLFGGPEKVGEEIRRTIRAQLGITASVGIAGSKFVAKLASDHRKPDGLMIVSPEESKAFVQSLPLERLWGVGPATSRALHDAGIRTIASLAEASGARLERVVGSAAGRLIRLARGEDDRPVVAESAMKSVSHEVTFADDQTDDGVLEGVLLGLAEQVARRARRAEVSGRTIALKLRLPDFTTLTRSRTLRSATRETKDVFRVAQTLMRRLEDRRRGVRLLGVGLSGLTHAPQLELDLFATGDFEEARSSEKSRHLLEAEDAIVERFGRSALARAKTLLSRAVDDTASMAGRPSLEVDVGARPESRQSPK